MSDTAERWRNMSKAEIAAVDVGTLWNTIDDLCDEIERLQKFVAATQRLGAAIVDMSMVGMRGERALAVNRLTNELLELIELGETDDE